MPATPSTPNKKAAHHEIDVSAEAMDMEEEEMDLELDQEDAEFTLDDVLAQDATDLDMNALASAADDELSSIYAIGKSGGLSMSSLAQADNLATEDETSFKLDSASLKAITGASNDEEDDEDVELSTRGWNSILGSTRRDSLSLPSFTRRDSFSLLSNRHLRSTSPELAEPVPEHKPRRSSRRSSLSLENKSNTSQTEADSQSSSSPVDINPDEETITLTTSTATKSSRSRRTSLVMDMTCTDLGEILQEDEKTRSLKSARKSRPSSRRTSLMDMTVTDVSQILMREEEPIAMNEEEVATQTIRMDLTRTDLSALLDSQEPEKIDLRRTISFKNRRQSLAMDETVSNFGAILDSSVALSEAAFEPSVVEGEETINLTTALETLEERAAKPVSSLLSKLNPAAPSATDSPARNTRTKSRRQSLAMEMTSSNLGQIIAEEELTSRTPKRTRGRQSLAMDHTISNFGEILAESAIETPKVTAKSSKSRRQSLAMDMTISGIGEILEEELDASSAPAVQVIETVKMTPKTPKVVQSAKSRRQSLAMDMTISNIGEILEQEEVAPSTSATPKTARTPRTRRQSMAMDMTISGIGGILEEDETTTSEILVATPKIATPSKTPKGRKSRRQSLAMDMTISNLGEIVDAEATPGPKTRAEYMPTPESAKKRTNLPTAVGIISGLGQLLSANNKPSTVAEVTMTETSAMDTMEEESGMDLATPEITANLEADIEAAEEMAIESTIELTSDQQDAQGEPEIDGNDMEMTADFPVTESADSVPIEEQDTIELPVVEGMPGTVNLGPSSEQAIEEIVEPYVVSKTSDAADEPTPELIPSTEEAGANAAVSDLAILQQASPSTDDEDILFSDVVSITSSFPNLSMSITSRNAIRRAMEAAGAVEPATIEESTNIVRDAAESHANLENAMEQDYAIEDEQDQTTLQSVKSVESVESPAVVIKSRRSSVASRRQSTASRRNSTRLSFLDTIDEPVDVGMDTAQLDALLSESTRTLAKRAPVPMSNASIFSALAIDNDIFKSVDEGARMDVDTAKYPLLAALSRAVPHKVSAQPFDAEAAHEIASLMAKTMGDRQSSGLSADDSSQMDVASTSMSDSIVLSQSNFVGIGDAEDEDNVNNASGYESVAESVAESIASGPATNASEQLDAAQRRFEAHIEAQLRTPAARRRSLLMSGAMTPGASPRRVAGRSSFTSTGRLSFAGVASPTPSHATSTMTLSGLDSLTTVANGNSLSRFLSTFGVNFLDSIASRRQSLGIRVAEPRSDYDRMVTVMRSQPELDLTDAIFSSLTTFAAECESHILEMEESCRDQCAAKEGVYQLFAQCITARHGEARRDLASLKQLALSEAKCHLNERFLGYHYESQLNQTLQITHASAKSHLTELEDRQAATFRTKMTLSKAIEDEASAAATSLPSTGANTALAKKSSNGSSAAAKSKLAAEQALEKSSEAESLTRSMLGWQLRQLTPTAQVYDFRNAVELYIETSASESAPGAAAEVIDMRLSSVMRVRTAEDDIEHQLVDSLVSAIPLRSYCGSGTSIFSAANEVSTTIGRILDLVTEIRLLRRSWFVESIEQIPYFGIAIAIRFSDPNSGNRFVTKLAIEHSYPFVATMPVEVDLAFSGFTPEQISEAVDEEVAKNTYKPLTRICKRLERLCKA